MDEDLLSLDRTYAIMAAMWDRRNEQEKTLDPKAFRKVDDALGLAMMFNLRNSTDAGFHRMFNRETDYLNRDNPKGNVIREHLVVLTKFILLDNLRLAGNEYGAFDDMEASRKAGAGASRGSKYEGGVPGLKHLRRFVTDYYPEMISIPHRLSRGLPHDGRIRLFETAFTKQETEEHLRKTKEMLSYYDPGLPPEYAVATDRATELAMLLKTYDPDDLAKQATYRRDVEKATGELPSDLFGEGRPSHWIVEQFRTYRFTVRPLFEELRWYVELKWFQRRSMKSALALLKRKVKFEYTRQDAKRAISLASSWFEDDVFVFRQVLPVSSALHFIERAEASGYLYKECLRQLKLPEVEQILCAENLAHEARGLGNTDEAIAGLEAGLRRWEKLGPGQITSWILDHAWLAGLYLGKGDEEAASKHRESLLSLLPEFESKASPGHAAHILLQVSDTASLYGDRDLEKRCLRDGLKASLRDDKLEDHVLYFQQCLGDLASYAKRLWVDGSDRFPHPDSREWRMDKLGSNFFEAKA